MLVVFAVILAGIAVGWFFAPRRLIVVQKAITPVIWLLLFLLGVEVGASPEVMRGLATLGGTALAIFVASTAGSIAAAWLLWRYVRTKKQRDEG